MREHCPHAKPVEECLICGAEERERRLQEVIEEILDPARLRRQIEHTPEEFCPASGVPYDRCVDCQPNYRPAEREVTS